MTDSEGVVLLLGRGFAIEVENKEFDVAPYEFVGLDSLTKNPEDMIGECMAISKSLNQ